MRRRVDSLLGIAIVVDDDSARFPVHTQVPVLAVLNVIVQKVENRGTLLFLEALDAACVQAVDIQRLGTGNRVHADDRMQRLNRLADVPVAVLMYRGL